MRPPVGKSGKSWNFSPRRHFFSASITSLSEMFPDGFEIKSSEMILRDGKFIDHFVVETKTGTREVYFDRGIYLEK